MTVTRPPLPPAAAAALDPDALDRLARMTAEIREDPARVRTHHPAAARTLGRGPLDPADPHGVLGPTLDDAVRGALLAALVEALADRPDTLAEEVGDLYRYGDAEEKRAVLRALGELPVQGSAALRLVQDALRTNDVRLVAAALGPWSAAHLDTEAWRQGVLKCLFTGVPLTAVAGLAERTDAELARMVAAYAYERVAAGRDVPSDVWLVLDRFPDALAASGLPAELDSPHEDRRAAARRALAGRASPTGPSSGAPMEA